MHQDSKNIENFSQYLDAARPSPSFEQEKAICFEKDTQYSTSRYNGLFFWKTVFMIALFAFGFTFAPASSSHTNSLNFDSILQVINQDRTQQQLKPLVYNPDLQKVAEQKAKHMLEYEYFSHVSPDGTKAWDFFDQNSILYEYAGENLALNYSNPFELEHDFMQSPSHRENLMSPLFSEVGIAIVNGTMNDQNVSIIVQIFAKTTDNHKPLALEK